MLEAKADREIARVLLHQFFRGLICSAIQFAPIDLVAGPSRTGKACHGKGLQPILLRVPSMLFPTRANAGANQFGMIPRNVVISGLQEWAGRIPNPFVWE